MEEPEKAKLRFTLIHNRPTYNGRSTRRKFAELQGDLPKSRRARVKHVDLSDYEHSEMEESIDVEEDGYKPSRDLKFCLGDYITDKEAHGIANVERERLDSSTPSLDLGEIDVSEPKLKPFDLMDISSVLRTHSTFEFAHVYTDNWKNFKFLEQVESLRDKYPVRWLDMNYQRVLIDGTVAVASGQEHEGSPIAMLTIERCQNKKRHYLRVLLNTTIVPSIQFDWKLFKGHLRGNNVSDICSLVDATVGLPLSWLIDNPTAAVAASEDTVKLNEKKEYLPIFNAAEFSKPGRRITVERMATLLRAGCEHLASDSFVRVDREDLDDDDEEWSENSQSDDLPPLPTGIKCKNCATNSSEDLFEMDDCWMCRACLKQIALNQIRTKSLPIRLALVVPTESTSYDILASILPLPLFNFYTKLAAIELIKLSPINDVIDLGECPGCNQVVDIANLNEYNCIHCECGIVWCSKCRKEPHWPMSCKVAADWRKRWQHHNIEGVERSQRLRKTTCSCSDPSIQVRRREFMQFNIYVEEDTRS
ncbi:hypothetical protein NECAME_08045 [Necator americanus]|uniref:IBR domain-containing protein n=1 Tax=Necator americanus TaxID=51031 RepID=W2TKN7_NECAM|nr:hypothetical protein NECAME_08045 [Necator americanus]ETN82333.1 hypothetical protein NECAME_08045 [Necator americanus]